MAKIALFSKRINTKNAITADLNLAVPRRLGELGQRVFTWARPASWDRLGEN